MTTDVVPLNQPSPDWRETYIFTVAATHHDDCALEAYGPTYESAARVAFEGLVIRTQIILERYNQFMSNADELLERAKACKDKALEIQNAWLPKSGGQP